MKIEFGVSCVMVDCVTLKEMTYHGLNTRSGLETVLISTNASPALW